MDKEEVKKTCSTCHKWLLRISFAKDRSRKDGLNHRCRICDSKRCKSYRQPYDPSHYKKNRRKILAQNRKWVEKNMDYRKKYRAARHAKLKSDPVRYEIWKEKARLDYQRRKKSSGHLS